MGVAPERAAGLAGGLLGGLAGLVLCRPINRILGVVFELFNRGFQATANGYARLVGVLLRRFVLVLFALRRHAGRDLLRLCGLSQGLLCREYLQEARLDRQTRAAPGWIGRRKAHSSRRSMVAEGQRREAILFPGLPRGFIPSQDMGYLLFNIQLPDSASLERTEDVLSRMGEIAHAITGIDATVGMAGQSLLLNAYGSNFGTMFLTLRRLTSGRRRRPITRPSPTSCGSRSRARSPTPRSPSSARRRCAAWAGPADT